MQKYSIWNVSCRNIHIMVYWAKILVMYRYMLHGHHDFLFGFDRIWLEKTLFLGFVQKYYFFGGSCRNITVPSYCIAAILCMWCVFFKDMKKHHKILQRIPSPNEPDSRTLGLVCKCENAWLDAMIIFQLCPVECQVRFPEGLLWHRWRVWPFANLINLRPLSPTHLCI